MPFECFPIVSRGLAPKEMHLLQINIFFFSEIKAIDLYSVSNELPPLEGFERGPQLYPDCCNLGDTNRWGGVRKERLTQRGLNSGSIYY